MWRRISVHIDILWIHVKGAVGCIGGYVAEERLIPVFFDKFQTSVTTYFTPKLNALKKRVLCGN